MTQRLPNLFVVGFGRSGTTSLHNYLAQHPQIFMSSAKEPNHFCTDVVFGESRRARFADRDAYLSLFEGATSEAVVGESSTMYILSTAAREAIASEVPSARIIISIRRPIDFLVSWHAHGVGIGYETEPDLRDALAIEPQRKGRPPHHLGSSVATTYRETINSMPQLVGAYLEAFGPEQVKIVTFDQLTRSQADTYSAICGFLGVDQDFAPDFEAKNYDPSNLHTMSLFRKVPAPIRSRIGPLAKPIVKRAAPLLARARGSNTPTPVADTELLADLALEFAPVVDELEIVSGLDLSAWKTSTS